MNCDKISVIVPVYRVEHYLRKCLDSIAGQTYQSLEIILVDDGSPDNCGDICDEYAAKDSRFRVIHKENGGVSSARNAGLDIAEGDWIAWVDSDDWIEADMLQYLLEDALSHGADIAICGMRKAGESTPLVFRYTEEQVLDREQALRAILENRSMTVSCCGKLSKRALWEGLRFPDLKIGEDLLTMGRLLDRADSVVCLPEVKYNYLTRPESAMTDGSLETRMDCWRAAFRQYRELSPKWPQLGPALAGRSAAAAIGVWGNYLSAEKDERRKFFPEIKRISVFCRSHCREALTHIELGIAGRIALRVTPYPAWWAFLIAGAASRLYRMKHKRPL